jgi:hypothetical protein
MSTEEDSEEPDALADTFAQVSNELAKARFETASIPAKKYGHVQEFTTYLVAQCYSIAYNELKAQEIKQDQLLDMVFEYLFFFIHLTDRFAFSILGDPSRHIVMQEAGEFAIMLAVVVLSPDSTSAEREYMFNDCVSRLNIAAGVYSHFKKLMPEPDEGTKATLFWEFSKRIQHMKGTGDNLAAIVGEEVFLVSSLETLDAKAFLDKMK